MSFAIVANPTGNNAVGQGLSNNQDRNIIELSERVFELFKNRTNGANVNVDLISWKALHQFAFERKPPEGQLLEAFRRLEKLDLIMPAVGQPEGYYALTSKGKATELADVIANRLRVGFKKAASALHRRRRFQILFISSLLAGVAWQVSGPVGFTVAGLREFYGYLGFVIGLVIVISAIGAWRYTLTFYEDEIFYRFFNSYLSTKTGNYREAETEIRKGVSLLQFKRRELASSRWRLASEDLWKVLEGITTLVWKRLLPAVVHRDVRVTRTTVQLADAFINLRLARLHEKVQQVLRDFPESEYKPATLSDKLRGNITIYRTVLLLGILVAALTLDVGVFGVLAFVEGRPLSGYYTNMATFYAPSILAIIGLRTVMGRISPASH